MDHSNNNNNNDRGVLIESSSSLIEPGYINFLQNDLPRWEYDITKHNIPKVFMTVDQNISATDRSCFFSVVTTFMVDGLWIVRNHQVCFFLLFSHLFQFFVIIFGGWHINKNVVNVVESYLPRKVSNGTSLNG